jgi:hypothetical protein
MLPVFILKVVITYINLNACFTFNLNILIVLNYVVILNIVFYLAFICIPQLSYIFLSQLKSRNNFSIISTLSNKTVSDILE